MADETEITYVLKMRDEAVRVLMNFEKELKATGSVSKDAADNLNEAAGGMDEIADKSGKATNGLGAVGKQLGALVTSGAIFYKLKTTITDTLDEFAKYDSGQSDIRKTTGLAGAELDKMGGSLRGISTDLATSTTDLQGFAATAGRAGVTGSQEILKVTKSFAEMQLALDGIDPEAFLRFLGNTKEGIGGIDKVAAALNSLDDSSSTSAARITDMGTDIAAAGASFKLSSQDVLAWSAVLAESGVNTGVAATTIQRLGVTIDKASATGGKSLESLAGIAGVTSDQFKKLATTDMASAINAILKGLGDIKGKNSATYYAALKEFQLDQVDSQTAISTLTAKYSRLQELRKISFGTDANEAKWANEIKTQLEKYESTRKGFEVAKENFQASVGAEFAAVLGPLLEATGELLVSMTNVFNSLPDGAQKFVVLGAAGVAAIGAIVIGAAGLGLTLTTITTGLAGLGITMGTSAAAVTAGAAAEAAALGGVAVAAEGATVATGALAAVTMALPWVALAAGVAAASYAIYEYATSTTDAEVAAAKLADLRTYDSFNKAAEGANNASASIDAMGAAAAIASVSVEDAKKKLDEIDAAGKLAAETQKLTGKAAGDMGGKFDEAKAKADALIVKLYGLQGAAILAAKAMADTNLLKAYDTARQQSDNRTQGVTGMLYRGLGGTKDPDPKKDPAVIEALRVKRLADAAVNDAKRGAAQLAATPKPKPGTPAPDSGSTFAPTPKKTGGSSGKGSSTPKQTDAERDAARDAKEREKEARDIRIETAAYAEQIGTLNQGYDARQRQLDIIAATSELRKKTGNETATLSAAEITALNKKTDAELAYKRASDESNSIQDMDRESALLQDQLTILGYTVDKRREEAAVLEVIRKAKAENRSSSAEEREAARQLARDKKDVDDATNADSSIQNSNSDTEYNRQSIQLIGADTLARRQNTAVLQTQVNAKRQNRTATKAEIDAAREAAASQFELDQAQQEFSDNQAFRMGQFDAVAGSMRDFATGAKSAKEAIADLARGLIDLIIQYQILGPIRRAFENSGGSGGGGGLFGKLFSLGTKAAAATTGVPAFATGGSMEITGNPGVDQNLLSLNGRTVARVSHGETLNIGKGGSIPGGGGGGGVTFAPVVQVTVDGGGKGQDPTEMGKMVGDAVTVKMHSFVKQESRPGGVLYRLQRG